MSAQGLSEVLAGLDNGEYNTNNPLLNKSSHPLGKVNELWNNISNISTAQHKHISRVTTSLSTRAEKTQKKKEKKQMLTNVEKS